MYGSAVEKGKSICTYRVLEYTAEELTLAAEADDKTGSTAETSFRFSSNGGEGASQFPS